MRIGTSSGQVESLQVAKNSVVPIKKQHDSHGPRRLCISRRGAQRHPNPPAASTSGPPFSTLAPASRSTRAAPGDSRGGCTGRSAASDEPVQSRSPATVGSFIHYLLIEFVLLVIFVDVLAAGIGVMLPWGLARAVSRAPRRRRRRRGMGPVVALVASAEVAGGPAKATRSEGAGRRRGQFIGRGEPLIRARPGGTGKTDMRAATINAAFSFVSNT